MSPTNTPDLRHLEMSTFYSIIHAGLNPLSGEKLAVGLLLRNRDQVRFAWSRNRVRVVRDLMGTDAYNLLELNLKALDRKVGSPDTGPAGLKLIQAEPRSAYELNEPYVSYLSKYSNNLLTVGPITPIEIDDPSEKFKELFRLFVDQREVMDPGRKKPDTSEVRARLRERTEKRVSWDTTLTSKDLPGLPLYQVKLDFIGKNEKGVIGEVVDFSKTEYHLDASINKTLTVSMLLDRNNNLGRAFLIGDEPDKKLLPAQHATWSAVREARGVTVVATVETGIVEDYLEQHGVQRWGDN